MNPDTIEEGNRPDGTITVKGIMTDGPRPEGMNTGIGDVTVDLRPEGTITGTESMMTIMMVTTMTIMTIIMLRTIADIVMSHWTTIQISVLVAEDGTRPNEPQF